MLQHIRDHSGKWFVKVIFGLIVLSFMIFGIGDIIRSIISHKPVAKIGSTKVSSEEFAHLSKQEFQRISALSEGRITPTQLRALGFHQKLVDQLIERHITEQEFDRLKLTASIELIKNNIRVQKEFQRNGQFDHSRYQELLQQYRLTERQYVDSLRKNYTQQQYFGSVAREGYLPLFYQDTLIKAMEQKWHFKVAEIRPKHVRVNNNPNEAELKDFYNGHRSEFSKPETRDIHVFVLDIAKRAEAFSATEEEINTEYQRRIAEFTTAEKRHIQVASFATKKEAQQAIIDVKMGKTLKAAAKKHSESQYQDIGEIEIDRLQPNIRNIVTPLKVGEISEPLENNFQHQVFVVKHITDENIKPLSNVRVKLIKDIKRQKFDGEYKDIKNGIDDDLAGGEPIDSVIQKYNLQKISFKGVERNVSKELDQKFQASHKAILDLAFSVNEQEASPVTDISADESIVVYAEKIHQAHVPDFESIRDQVKKSWIENNTNASMKTLALALTKANAENFISMLSQKGIPIKSKLTLSRKNLAEDDYVKTTNSRSVFQRALVLGGKLTSFGEIDGGYLLVVAIAPEPFHVSALKNEDLEKYRNDLNEAAKRDVADALVNAFRNFHTVKIYDENLNALIQNEDM